MSQRFSISSILLFLSLAVAQDVSLSIADASLNSAAKVLSVAGALDYTGPIPFRNSSTLSTLLPCAFQNCKDCPLDASIIFLEAPFVTFSQTTGASASVSGALVTFSVNGSTIATANANGSTILNFSKSEDRAGNIKIQAKVIELYIDIQSTCDGGSVSPALKVEINGLIDALCTDQVIPFINNKFPGIPIPTLAGFVLYNMTTTVMDKYLQVGLDIGSESVFGSPRIQGGAPPPPPRQFATAITHGDFNINASTTAIKKAINIYLPKLISQLGNIAVPAMSGEADSIKWSTAATSVEDIHIGQATIDVLPNVGVAITLSKISLAIPSTAFEVSKHIIISLHCGGHFSGTLANTRVAVTMKIDRDKTGLPVVTPTSTWSWGAVDIDETLDHAACRVIQDIAKLFVGSITNKIKAAIEQSVPAAVNTAVAAEANAALAGLTQPINVDNYASIDLALATTPIFTADEIELSLLGVWGPPLELKERT